MSKVMQRTGAVFFAVCFALTACQQSDRPTEQPATSGIFRPSVNVGVLTDQPGLGQLTLGSNERGGFDVDLYRWLGNDHEDPPVFTPVPVDLTYDERISALQHGGAQLVVATFSITDDRRKSVGFAGPYMLTQQGILVRAGDNRVQNINNLDGKTVCTISGNTSEKQFGKSSLKITLTVDAGLRGCVERLIGKKVDAVSTDQLILSGTARNDPTNLSVVKDLTFGAQERYGVGLPHGDTAACEKVTAKLKRFITSGSWDLFFAAHFPDLDHDHYKPDPNNLDPC